jgi:hypothetical protein
MYFSAGGTVKGAEGYKDFFGDGSEKFFFPLAGHRSDILNRAYIQHSFDYDRYRVVDGELCLEYLKTDSKNIYVYSNSYISRSSWSATTISMKVHINADINDGKWVHIVGIGEYDMRNGYRQPGLWAHANDKTMLHCRNDSEDKSNDGTNSETGALPHEEWFLLTVSIEPMRMIVWVGDNKIIDYVPAAPFRKYDRQLILNGYNYYGGISVKDVRIFNRTMKDVDIDKLNKHFIETRKPFVKNDRYDTLSKGKTLRVFPLEESVNDVINNETMDPIDGVNQMQLYKGQLHPGHDQYRIKNLPVDDSTDAITVSGMMYVDGEGHMMLGMLSHDLYSASGGFGFNTGQSDLYGVAHSIVNRKWKHIIVTFKKGRYGDLFIDGIRQTLQHFATVPTEVNPSLSPTIAVSGWLNDGNYRYSGWYKKLKVIAGELTDEEAMQLATEQWPVDRSIKSFTPAGGYYVSCDEDDNDTMYSCITKAAKFGQTTFIAEHLVPDVEVIAYPIERARRLIWEKTEALKNEAEDGKKSYSMNLARVPSEYVEMYNGELAFKMSDSFTIDTGMSRDKVKSVYMRAYYDGISNICVGNMVYNRLHIQITGTKVYMQWRDGGASSGTWNYSGYELPEELLNTWVDIVVSLNARGTQFDRVTANGIVLAQTSTYWSDDGTRVSKLFDGTVHIGACQANGSITYGNGYVSKVELFSSYMGQKNIANIISGKEYNYGIPKYSKSDTQMYRDSDGNVYGMYMDATILPRSEAENDMWFHNSIPGVIEDAEMCTGIQKPNLKGFIKREAGNTFSENGYYAKSNSNEVLGGFKDRLYGSWWHGIYKTIGGLPPLTKVRVVVHVLLIDSIDQSNNDRFIVEAGNKQLRISPSRGMRDQIASFDELICVQPTILDIEGGSWGHHGLGETVASFAFDVDTNSSGQVYTRVRCNFNQYYNDESMGLVAVDIYEID